MPSPKRTVLITGCSDGGLGAALAIAFHNAGLHVYATARTPSKMSHISSLGIETLVLDVLSDTSIASCVAKLPSLDILVNNAGAGYTVTVTDIDIAKAKKLFDLNVWSYIAVANAFLPLLMRSKNGGMIINNTSIVSEVALPFQAAYNASKAAVSMFSQIQRLELATFNITVVELKTGVVVSNFLASKEVALPSTVPEESIWVKAKEEVERGLRQDSMVGTGIEAGKWARGVVGDVLKTSPPPVIWRGGSAFLVRLGTVLPFGTLDGTAKKTTGLDVVQDILKR
ncbi:hypothetical protein BJ875DRAFT_156366 [Amylocarpus encephaloides]|uniref:Uncharacterized protein n=1 Tax=Amylocarpus encephaloides TaxID=45428 RepID=A0A9P7YPL2_9HELO|nr:hypothetical protein BJ875DRAFT_156366 [Amylocarpus encephaloides]